MTGPDATDSPSGDSTTRLKNHCPRWHTSSASVGFAFSRIRRWCSPKIIGISSLFDEFNRALEPLFAGLPADLTEENIQSRIRGNLLMALSNKFGALVLTTGNKSEMAVGYCTLYGDMVGALAVIGDLVKTRVYAICRWLNREREVIPQDILTKPPSAELRPGQKDTDSLPPYEVLDPILEAWADNDAPLARYAAGMWGPKEAERLLEREGRQWRNP